MQSSPAAKPSQRLIRLAREEKARRVLEGRSRQVADQSWIDARQAPAWFHEGQLKSWKSRAMDVINCAGTQGGKTAGEAYFLLREIQRSAPLILKLGVGNYIYAGPTLTLMESQAIPQFKDLFEEHHQLGRLVQGKKPRFYFSVHGSKRLLGFVVAIVVHFAYTNDSSNLESVTALGGCWDESGQKENKLASYRAYNRRLKLARSTTFGEMREWILSDPGRIQKLQWWLDTYYADEGPDARFGRRQFATTPYEWGWFKDQVVDRAINGEDGFEFFNWPSWLNPQVSEEECRKELENGMPLWEWQMMYLGLFTMPAGVVFDCFDKDNIWKPFDIPDEWTRYAGIDFGNVNTAAVKVAEERKILGQDQHGNIKWGEPTGRFFLYSSYKNRSDSVDAHASAISKGEPRKLTGAGGSHQESGWRQAYRKCGIELRDPSPDVRDLEVRIQCLYAALKTKELIVFETESEVIEQIRHMSRELDDAGRPTEKIKDEAQYHFVAAGSYIMANRKPPRAKITVSQARR